MTYELGRRKGKLSPFTNHMIVYVENPKESTLKLLKRVNPIGYKNQ
jgi:hypothetical protein